MPKNSVRGVLWRVISALVLTAGLAGCEGETPPAKGASGGPDASGGSGRAERLNIVATTGMVADLVRQVAGEHARVEGLMGEGVDPHLYAPSTADVQKILDADVVFYNGLMLEGKMADTFVRAGRLGKKVFAVTESLPSEMLRSPPDFGGHVDPHVWMSVSSWTGCIEIVVEALSELDPGRASLYRENGSAYRAALTGLDTYVREVIASIPAEQRALITAHDAFGYFGSSYDIRVIGIQGISTESEAGLDDINRLVSFIVDNAISAVFVESSVASTNVEALIAGARARGHTVTIGGTLFSDAMGEPGTYRGTYIGMMDHNSTTIARALGGTAPARGWKDDLE
jgi:manganese/zinc/iron transport system substrate-binding protein